jgi:hypothetical protein
MPRISVILVRSVYSGYYQRILLVYYPVGKIEFFVLILIAQSRKIVRVAYIMSKVVYLIFLPIPNTHNKYLVKFVVFF